MKLIYNADKKSIYIEDCKELRELKFCSSELSEDDFRKRTEIIVNNILKHPKALAAVQKALEKGEIMVVFKDHKEILSVAAWNSHLRFIYLNKDFTEPFELLYYFIFEICNAKNSLIENLSPINCEDADDYAEKFETAELVTRNEAIAIMKEGNTLGIGWPPIEEDALPTLTLEMALLKASAPLSSNAKGYHGYTHADIYRKQYYQSMLPKHEYDINTLPALLETQRKHFPKKEIYFGMVTYYKESIEREQRLLKNAQQTLEALKVSGELSFELEQTYIKWIGEHSSNIQTFEQKYNEAEQDALKRYQEAIIPAEKLIKETEDRLKSAHANKQKALSELERLEKRAKEELKNIDENEKLEDLISEKSQRYLADALKFKELISGLSQVSQEKLLPVKDEVLQFYNTFQGMLAIIQNPSDMDRKKVLEQLETSNSQTKSIIEKLTIIKDAEDQSLSAKALTPLYEKEKEEDRKLRFEKQKISSAPAMKA